MPIKITMPALSPTMEEGTLSKWLVKEGDNVTSGDVIAEIETDKATMEVEAVDEGVVAKILVPAGSAGVKVNSVIAILAADGEDVAAAAKAADASTSSDVVKDVAVASDNQTLIQQSAPTPQTADAQGSVAQANATQDISTQSNAGKGNRVFSSPLARRLAKDGGLDIATVAGTGPHGRVIKRDVEAALQSGTAKVASNAAANAAAQTPASAAPIISAPSDDAVLKLFKEDEYEVVPHDTMRKTIARRLVESKLTVPHFYVTVDCELDALLKLRAELNSAAPMVKNDAGTTPAYKLSVNDMVIKVVAMALKAQPDANVSWLDQGMIRHKHADIGVAVSIPNGLITPIVRHADEKSLSAISNEMKDLAKRARERKLKPEEYQGGSSSVSNMGMFGVKSFSAIVNPPQATIFAIGAGIQRAVVKDGALAIANVMSVTISTDHRAVDGALAAQLAQTFKGLIENPMSMLV
ncbi:pyruvate dehydrogenase complex dihydrolipoamide acetyltransferase [Bartonella sp. HY329]|uniref:pyruvate dehydrogenase complex dihydrolipoamide acetyltransferase n=1 Tax=unclassified Bartonella TaxID=2645622 RepID=UPI0021CA64E4|nr:MULTISPECIES: pyruvate dehydrogenase complex dihydrolipoamide acetyltransferase [unclassified Bartonella]UXM94681.1 pyruvate dehydrogenase complex dihydrolipoamide acetyltransferase [Bartonella sp. HY329]UXN09004.1 pyruvate dehydrogenase complex dihydrolipoamide acetyltransferase [Bartonella sp. HY328]